MKDETQTNMEVADNTIPAIPEIPEAEHPGGIEMIEWVFTNDKTNPYARILFHGLYNGAFANKLGIMQAKAKDSDTVDTLIVGVEIVPGQEYPNVYPLARVLREEELSNYMEPDGLGNYAS